MKSRTKVTIYDLARELNTSASTVSRALQDHPRISKKTKEAVMALAEKMNFHPDPVAHHLRTGKGSVIGVIVPRIDRYFFSSVIGGIESVAHKAGYSVLISQSNENWEEEKAIVKTMLGKKVDGLAISLAAGTIDYKHLELIINRGVPVVFFDRVPPQLNASRVEIDNYEAAYHVVNHLLEQGYKRIVHLSGPQELSVYKQRLNGYCQALADAGIAIEEELIIPGSITIETGERSAKQILAMPNRPDAIFAAGDYSAMGAMYILKKSGIHIPNEIAVVGFANEPFDSLVDPPLTSVDQLNRSMGIKVAELLLKEMGQKESDRIPENIVMKSLLIKRESSTRTNSK